MSGKASDKLDLMLALKHSAVVTGSLALTLIFLYILSGVEKFSLTLMRDIPPVFVVLSVLFVFNLAFSFSMIDQLLS